MTVYLVGAGPGDPGLITVRGAEVLAGADVVVYDRLSVASLLDLAPADAERISVGKAPGHAGMEQEAINALLVERGKAGQSVVRLKGGDPFVFARGGEEAEALLDAGVPFEVVPGITSAVAVPAYAGVPLTRRGMATSFTVVTGHEDPWAATETDWDAVAHVGGTIVILMGAATRAAIAERLLGAGLAPDTPVAATTWGTRSDQRTIRTTLAGLGAADVRAPATLVVGAVAGLELSWFERRPLLGRRVVVTRARPQASVLSERLRLLGAEPVEVPVIRIVPPTDGGAGLDAAATSVAGGRYDWVVFTSVNAVDAFVGRLDDVRRLPAIAAVGPGTATALAGQRVVPDLVPEDATSEALAGAFPRPPAGGGRVLLPLGNLAGRVLPDTLRAAGWEVKVVEAYRTEAVVPSPELVAAASGADAIAFTSSSAVTNFLDAAGLDALPPLAVSIGPSTSATARARGVKALVEADVHTIDGLLDALVGNLGGGERRLIP